MSDQYEPSELNEMYKTYQLGLDVRDFKNSPLGQYLMRRVAEERIDAIADLVEVSPVDAEGVRALQSTIQRCDSFEFWLDDAIAAAKNVKAQLDPDSQENTL